MIYIALASKQELMPLSYLTGIVKHFCSQTCIRMLTKT